MVVLLNSTIRGEGYPVILLHGLFGDGANLNSLARSLTPRYQVHSIDLRNHGRSPHVAEMDYQTMMEDVADYCERNEIAECAVIGHSMGGKVAMSLALSQPDLVNALIVADIAPVKYPPHHDQIFKGLTSLDLRTIKNRSQADDALKPFIEDSAVRQFILKSLVQNSKREFEWRINVEAIVREYEEILSEPYGSTPYSKATLFVLGASSDYMKPEYKNQTLALFPNAKSKIISGASHWLHAEKPETFNKICLKFLDEHVCHVTRNH